VVGIVGLLSTTALFRLRKWGLWLNVVLCVLNILSAAPRLIEAPNAALQIAATVSVVGFALIVVLGVLLSSRRAFEASYVP
jgi:hypothetical protein